jgi:hypothetical protein
MKRNAKKLGLHRETVRTLTGRALSDVAGATYATCAVTCQHSCNGSCAGCPPPPAPPVTASASVIQPAACGSKGAQNTGN